MKEKIKKIPGVKFLIRFRDKLVLLKEYYKDYKIFEKHYMKSKLNVKKIEYSMLLIDHTLEKGMSNLNPRPFGVEKVKALMKLINEYKKMGGTNSFAFSLTINTLKSYLSFYEKKNWINYNEYKELSVFLKEYDDILFLPSGSFDLKKSDFILDSKIDYEKFLTSRHSVRNYSIKKIADDDINKAVNMAIKSPSACNRQMCKVYYISTDNNIEIVKKYAKGLGNFNFNNGIQFFVITFDINSFNFYGDRNYGWFNAGLFSMNFVNALHSLEIGSCFLQFGNTNKEEMKLKKLLNIPENERIAVILAAGYYDEISRIPYSTRKSIDDVYFKR